MANNITEPDVSRDLVLPAGVAKFAQEIDGQVGGYLDLGESEEMTITIAQETLERNTRRDSGREQIARKVTSTTRNSTLSVLSINTENLSLFLAATNQLYVQDTSAVTDEEAPLIRLGKEFYLGMTDANPGGVMGCSAVVIRNQPASPSAWAADTGYAVGAVVAGVTTAADIYRCKQAGISGASEPSFDTASVASSAAEGSLTSDNGVVWEYIAAASATFVADTDYQLDDTPDTGARFKWISTTNNPRYGYVDYTPSSVSRTRIETGATVELDGSLIIQSANDGSDFRYIMPSVRLTSDGDLALINDGSAFQQISFGCSIQSGSRPAIILDGEPLAV